MVAACSIKPLITGSELAPKPTVKISLHCCCMCRQWPCCCALDRQRIVGDAAQVWQDPALKLSPSSFCRESVNSKAPSASSWFALDGAVSSIPHDPVGWKIVVSVRLLLVLPGNQLISPICSIIGGWPGVQDLQVGGSGRVAASHAGAQAGG